MPGRSSPFAPLSRFRGEATVYKRRRRKIVKSQSRAQARRRLAHESRPRPRWSRLNEDGAGTPLGTTPGWKGRTGRGRWRHPQEGPDPKDLLQGAQRRGVRVVDAVAEGVALGQGRDHEEGQGVPEVIAVCALALVWRCLMSARCGSSEACVDRRHAFFMEVDIGRAMGYTSQLDEGVLGRVLVDGGLSQGGAAPAPRGIRHP